MKCLFNIVIEQIVPVQNLLERVAPLQKKQAILNTRGYGCSSLLNLPPLLQQWA